MFKGKNLDKCGCSQYLVINEKRRGALYTEIFMISRSWSGITRRGRRRSVMSQRNSPLRRNRSTGGPTAINSGWIPFQTQVLPPYFYIRSPFASICTAFGFTPFMLSLWKCMPKVFPVISGGGRGRQIFELSNQVVPISSVA